LTEDSLAWYFLGSAYLREAKGPGLRGTASQAEQALRRSLKLDPQFAQAHRNLALALFVQDSQEPPVPGLAARPGPVAAQQESKRTEAKQELGEAQRLDPALPVKGVEAHAKVIQNRFTEAEQLYQQALREEPGEVSYAQGVAACILQHRQRPSPRAPDVRAMLNRFPEDEGLMCLHAVALAVDGDARAAGRELERVRRRGIDPADILPPEIVQEIDKQAAPGLLEQFAWTMLYFAALYGAVIVLMALAGLLLAGQTRGSRALQLLGVHADELITQGQVLRTRNETWLAKLYAFALMGGLILFYLSIPFVILGLLGGTALLLYAIFMLGRIPVKLVLLVFIAGGGAAWAVLKSVFARPGRGSFGLPKTRDDCPRLHHVLADVAQRVDTDPVDEVYVAPGSSIGVHQDGRGPFGMFGVKQRVLTLGLSTMRFLTVSELQAILAHEYAHFSHRDTFYSRFIYQVDLSIEQALRGMGQTGGYLNYVNPFFWFLYLYYKAYSLLSAGFSRSREFLADRMASSLYGSDVFARGLTKVSTDGALFEMTIYQNISQLLEEDKAFVNMYSAFHNYRNEQLDANEREALYQKLLESRETLFASHPTFRERLEAVEALPRADHSDTTPALELFDNPEEIEKELTEFLTGYIHHLRRLQAQQAAHT
jgi:Zn-dependent protease with chaperone function/Flp pilus assembly protein TadD